MEEEGEEMFATADADETVMDETADEVRYGLEDEPWYMREVRMTLEEELHDVDVDVVTRAVEALSQMSGNGQAVQICEKISMPKLVNEDVKKAAEELDLDSTRFLVAMYYRFQKARMAFDQQKKHLSEEAQGNLCVTGFSKLSSSCEKFVHSIMDHYCTVHPVLKWCTANVGVGPVLSAGLLAHIRIKDDNGRVVCPTAGHIWSFAGWDPTRKWISSAQGKTALKKHGFEPSSTKKVPRETMLQIVEDLGGDSRILFGLKNAEVVKAKDLYNTIVKRPFNAEFKKLCWKVGVSFKNTCNSVDKLGERSYGTIYKERKEMETRKNENGDYADIAKDLAGTVGAATQARKHYSEGRLPPAHIQARAQRYAVKIFLAHLHEVMFRYYVGEEPPRPYPIIHQGHAHEIRPFVPTKIEELDDFIAEQAVKQAARQAAKKAAKKSD